MPGRAGVRPTAARGSPRARRRPVEARVRAGGRHELDPDGEAVLGREPDGEADAGDAREVRRDRREVVEVHGQRVVELLAELERRGGRRRRDQHVDLLERGVEVALDERAHLLRAAVVGVVVAGAQRVGAEDYPALDLGAEPGLARRRHDVLDGAAAGRVHAEAEAHRVELGEVARRLRGEDQVVRGDGVLEVRGGDLDDLGAGLLEQVERLAEALRDAGLEALAVELLHDADAHALHGSLALPCARGLGERGPRVGQRRGVARVVPADDVVHERRVEHRAGDGAHLVEARGERDGAVAAHAAVGGLDAHGSGDGGGLADGAARVGAESDGRLERGDRGRGSAARATGDSVEVPRVVRRAERGVLGGGAHRELVHVGLAERHETRSAEPLDDRGVVGRGPALEHARARGGRHVDGAEHVLDRDGHAGERPERGAVGALRVDLGGAPERALTGDVEERVDVAVDVVDAVEVRAHGVDAGDLAGGEAVGEVGGAEAREVVGHGAPTALRRGSPTP